MEKELEDVDYRGRTGGSRGRGRMKRGGRKGGERVGLEGGGGAAAAASYVLSGACRKTSTECHETVHLLDLCQVMHVSKEKPSRIDAEGQKGTQKDKE